MRRSLIWNILSFCFWIYIVISVCFSVYTGISSEDLTGIENVPQENIIKYVIYAFVFYGGSVILKNFIPILVWIGISIGLKQAKSNKLSAEDLTESKEYYRDILYGYSPTELRRVDDIKLEPVCDISAALLHLKLKKIIDLDEKNEKIIVNNIPDNITRNEKMLLDSIKDGKITNMNFYMFSLKACEDAQEHGLLKKKDQSIGKIVLKVLKAVIIALIIYTCVFAFVFYGVEGVGEHWKQILLLYLIPAFILSVLVGGIVFTITLMSYNVIDPFNSYIRTKKGEEVNHKLEGLKKFLNDFSLIQDRTKIEDLMIWDEYLIYSILFGKNNDIATKTYYKYVKQWTDQTTSKNIFDSKIDKGDD